MKHQFRSLNITLQEIDVRSVCHQGLRINEVNTDYMLPREVDDCVLDVYRTFSRD
jgi:hypothetical protein